MVDTSAPSIGGTVFRVRGIPPSLDRIGLAQLLAKEFSAGVIIPPGSDSNPAHSELHAEVSEISPSCARRNTFTALLEFKPCVPELLKTLHYNDIIAVSLDGHGRKNLAIYIDRDFCGLTQLYPTSPETEIIAE